MIRGPQRGNRVMVWSGWAIVVGCYGMAAWWLATGRPAQTVLQLALGSAVLACLVFATRVDR